MGRPSLTYAESKEKVKAFLFEYISDVAQVDNGGCVALSVLRKMMHYKGTEAFMDVALRALVKEGRISIWKEGDNGLVYLLGEDNDNDRKSDESSEGSSGQPSAGE